jgi:hypothetical protein
VEADQVAGQERAQQLAVPGQQPEDVEGGEGDVQEEGQARLGQLAADRLGREHQLVVVHPDEAHAVRLGDGRFGEAPVHVCVLLEIACVEAGPGRERVHQRPEGAIRETVVVALDVGLAEQHRMDAIGLAAGLDALARAHFDPRPADPGAAAPAEHGFEGGDEPARRVPPLQLASRACEGKWQAVARDDDGQLRRPRSGVALASRGHAREITRPRARSPTGREPRGRGGV